MAYRFELDPMGAGAPAPPNELLQDLFAPGSVRGYAAGRPAAEGLRDVNPMSILRRGSEQYGITPWEELFDPNTGQVVDLEGMLRSLNFVPISRGIFLNPGEDIPTYQSGGGLMGQLHQWLAGLGLEVPGGAPGGTALAPGQNQGAVAGRGGAIAYNPENLAYTSSDLGGIDLAGATEDELNRWAQETWGVDFQTFAASGPRLNEGRQAWMEDPSIWFDPANPYDLARNKIPGLRKADSALRAAQYGDWVRQREAEQATRRNTNTVEQEIMAAMMNPQVARSSLGAMLGAQTPQMVNLGQLMGGLVPSPMGYDYQLQRALLPEQLRNALAQMQAQMG